MERINAYKAFDGKIFYNWEECREHEQNLKERALVNNIKFYDSNNNLINIEKTYDINYILYKIHKVIIPSDEDCDILNEWLDNYCVRKEDIYFPHKGTWYFVPVTSIDVVSEDEMSDCGNGK